MVPFAEDGSGGHAGVFSLRECLALYASVLCLSLSGFPVSHLTEIATREQAELLSPKTLNTEARQEGSLLLPA